MVPEEAAINTVKLSRHFATVADKKKYQKDPAAYEASDKRYKGHYSLLNPVSFGSKKYLPLATRSIAVKMPGRGELNWPVRGGKLMWRRVDDKAALQPADSQSASFEFTLHRHDPDDPGEYRKFLTLVKTYTVRKGDHSIEVSLRVVNHSDLPLEVTLDQCGPTGLSREGVRADNRQVAYGRLQPADQKVQIKLESSGELKDMTLGEPKDLGTSNEKEPLLWIGNVNKFFGCMMYLVPKEEGRLEAPSYHATFYRTAIEEKADSRTFLTSLKMTGLQIAPKKSFTVTFDLYAGSKSSDVLSGVPKYEKLNYVDTIDFGWCTISWLAFGMMWLLQKLSIVAFGNYGLAIILLVILVRLGMHPLTKKGQVSMMKMQKLGPQVQKLKAKYGNDKETLNREMMKFYKEQGATPLLGCLPMLIQMPIWIALWTSINTAVELRHAAFLPVWIVDLAAPDALVSWAPAVRIPIISWMLGSISSFNLLPLLLCVAMVIQSRFNPQMAQSAAGSDQARQQKKMMMWMMPAMMLLIFYNAPSGLTLYIMASTFFGVTEQYVIRKHIKAKEEAQAAVETRVQMPGKGPRSSRPKKPKGPTWVKKG